MVYTMTITISCFTWMIKKGVGEQPLSRMTWLNGKSKNGWGSKSLAERPTWKVLNLPFQVR